MKLEKGTFGIFPAIQCESMKDPHLQIIFTWLCFFANKDGKCFPSIGTLARKCGITKPTIIKKLKELEVLGFIKKTTRCIDKNYTSNLYEVHLLPSKGDLLGSKGDLPGVVKEVYQGVVKEVYSNQKNIYNQNHLNQNNMSHSKCDEDIKKSKVDYTQEFEEFWNWYPKRAGNINKSGAFKQWNTRLKEGHSADEIIAGAKRYHAYSNSANNTGTEYVKMAQTFLGRDKHFLEPWEIKHEPRNTKHTVASFARQCAKIGAELKEEQQKIT